MTWTKRSRAAVGGLAVLAVIAAAGTASRVWQDDPAKLTGLVVTSAGRPIKGADVMTPSGSHTHTDSHGRFEAGDNAGWVTASTSGWIPRTRAGVPGHDLLIRLAAKKPDTVTFAFGGDVMFGRRFYDPNDDGSLGGLLPLHATVAEHERLLAGVAPLFADADIAAVNLETPLVDEPYYDPSQPRPAGFHPTKDFAFASAPVAAQALHDLGIDVVDIGNNHLYDALDSGVTSTRTHLEAAGFGAGSGFFGAGLRPRDAWAPAVQVVNGQRVAFVGCTSILGEDQPLTYVADKTKGGAAACSVARLRRAVADARDEADIVVAMVHGGFEYGRAPSGQIRALSDAALDAGATMVINHHPHVVGGLRFAGGKLTAWTLGNLLFDQTVWPTFESYVLHVAVRKNRVVSAWLEPIRIQGFSPTGVFGDDARWVTGGALARSKGPWVQDQGSLWLDAAGAANQSDEHYAGATLARIDSGCAPGSARELLWTGDFEVGDLEGQRAPLWNAQIPGPYRKVDSDAAHHGSGGVLLNRTGTNSDDVVLSVDHRVLVHANDRLTFLADSRGRQGQPDADLQLSWYNDTLGSSQERTVVPMPGNEDWETVRVDVTVPRHAVAVQPYIRVHPPTKGFSQLAVDDVALVDWDEPGCDYLRGNLTATDVALAPLQPHVVLTPVVARPINVAQPPPLRRGPQALGE